MIRLNRSKFGNWPSGPASRLANRTRWFDPSGLMVGGAPSRYRINQSLRFRASNSAFLSRTPASNANSALFTVSLWAKRGALTGAYQGIITDGATSFTSGLFFGPANQLEAFVANQVGVSTGVSTSAVLRDPTAWYHIVWVVDTNNATANDRNQIWVNGVRQAVTGSFPTLGFTGGWTTSFPWRIGSNTSTTPWFSDCYLAEVIRVDGQALTPSSFGAFDPTTNSWVPRRYTGTYGTNGFYLPFNDAASTTTIGLDRSGNGNNWTSSGISVTSGVTFDQMLDSPTSNYAVFNGVALRGQTGNTANANMSITAGTANPSQMRANSTINATAGRFYFEATFAAINSAGSSLVGVQDTSLAAVTAVPTSDTRPMAGTWTLSDDGAITANGGAPVASGLSAFSTSDIAQIAFDVGTGQAWVGRNNTWVGVPGVSGASFTGLPADLVAHFMVGARASSNTINVNFGQRPFAYTPPTGFVALNTANLPTPTIQRGDDGFDAVLRAGSNSPVTVTGRRFSPDVVWTKSRNTADHHNVADKVRGTSLNLQTSNTNAEDTLGILTAFNADGYTLGGGFGRTNAAGQNFVDWMWREGAAYGFDIVTYTGNGVAGRTVAHGLNAVPHFMAVKKRNGATSWVVYHRNANASPQNGYLLLDSTSAFIADVAGWNNTAPTSSVFTLGNGNALNFNSDTYIAYLWTSIPGFSLFGSYTGNGSADGPFVWCGFRPRFVMIKGATVATSWVLYDAARNTFNVVNNALYPNLSIVEDTAPGDIDITAGGFKLREGGGVSTNNSGETYIFAAFAENPFKFANAR